MSLVRIHLPDNTVREFSHEPTVLELAQSIGAGLAKATVGAQINGNKEIIDFRQRLKDGTKVKIVTLNSPEGLEVIRHSAAHIMAQAVQELWPQVKVTIGPVIENGFYYDFDTPQPFTPEDIEKIENKMHEIIRRDLEITRQQWPIAQAQETFKKMGEKFKVEIIEDLAAQGENTVSVYHQGQWFDLCRGPHVQRTGQIKAVKILSIAAAYWRGDEKRESLQRIYATAFDSKEALDKYLHNLEEAKKRDHRKLGKELSLFYQHPWAPGGVWFTGRGATIFNELQKFLRELYYEYGYQEVITPQLFDAELFKTSGHYQAYKDNMYFVEVDEREHGIKPMNCPSHYLLYASELHSYRDLPIRFADFGRLHRHERSGTLHGITRVRSLTQDDAHIFLSIDQLESEIKNFMTFLQRVYTRLGMTNYKVYFSTRPEKRIGSDEVWDQAEAALQKALKVLNLDYILNPGDGAFYGPKLDVMFVDALERSWQLGTLQLDFNAAERFDLKFIGSDNKEHRPVILHRAILGSFERFIGIYLEHTAGKLPLWLAPIQVAIINVSEKQAGYCSELVEKLRGHGIRVHFDNRAEKMGYKIREAQMQKIPYMLVIGDKEVDTKTLSVRLLSGQQKNQMPVEDFIHLLLQEIRERRLSSLMSNKTEEVTH